jgi:hypothetical protein
MRQILAKRKARLTPCLFQSLFLMTVFALPKPGFGNLLKNVRKLSSACRHKIHENSTNQTKIRLIRLICLAGNKIGLFSGAK